MRFEGASFMKDAFMNLVLERKKGKVELVSPLDSQRLFPGSFVGIEGIFYGKDPLLSPFTQR